MMPNDRVQPGVDNAPEDSPAKSAARREILGLWTGILAGPVLWFCQQQLCFALVPWVCAHGGVIWLHLVTLATLVGTAAAGGLALLYWRRPYQSESLSAHQQRVRFMAMLGLLSSGFFILVIIAQGIPNFVLDPCQR